MSKAVLFPGQGSQYTGMGKKLAASNDRVKELFEEADEILGYNLTGIMLEGPEEELRQTRNTQPAIYLHSIALFESLDLEPQMAAGHSLGEFTAITAAGAINFRDGLELVALRGELMQKAGEEKKGAMAAIIGMDDEIVANICQEATEQTFKTVVPANYNSPGQVVISGDEKAVEEAIELARGRGCRLAKPLPVSGAFHSELMKPAYKGLEQKLNETNFESPDFPVYSNVSALPSTDPDEIRNHLLRQLLSPVRWTQTLQNMYDDGATKFIEVGPGKVLQGLVKRTLSGKEIEISGVDH